MPKLQGGFEVCLRGPVSVRSWPPRAQGGRQEFKIQDQTLPEVRINMSTPAGHKQKRNSGKFLESLKKLYFCLGRYWLTGYCVYGPRCNFLHNEVTLEDEQYLKRKMRSNSIGSTHSLNQLNMGAGSSNDLLFTPSLPVSRCETKL